MNSQQFEREAKWMMERGEIDHLKNGEPAIPVSLTTTETLPRIPRQERKQFLYQQFSTKLNGMIGKGLEVDFNTISPSGQTVDAKISVQNLKILFEELKQKSLSIYTIQKRQIV